MWRWFGLFDMNGFCLPSATGFRFFTDENIKKTSIITAIMKLATLMDVQFKERGGLNRSRVLCDDACNVSSPPTALTLNKMTDDCKSITFLELHFKGVNDIKTHL